MRFKMKLAKCLPLTRISIEGESSIARLEMVPMFAKCDLVTNSLPPQKGWPYYLKLTHTETHISGEIQSLSQNLVVRRN